MTNSTEQKSNEIMNHKIEPITTKDADLLESEMEVPEFFKPPENDDYKWELVWRNIIFLIVLHTCAIYAGLDLLIRFCWPVIIWSKFTFCYM